MPKVIEVVRAVAPTIGTLLAATGPVGAAAGAVLTSVLGIPSDASSKAIEKAIAEATPDQLLALKKADQEFAIAMRQSDIKEEEVHAADRASARQREVAHSDDVPMYLGFIIVAGFFVAVFMVLAGYVEGLTDPSVAIMIGSVVGYVSAKADQVISYYFGSSSGSKAKTDAMANMLKK